MMEIFDIQGPPFLACLAMLAILSYIGIHVLKREVIFIDIALAQIAAVGSIAAQVVFHIHGPSLYAHALCLAATLVAAAFFAVVRRRITEIPLEAIIGVTYAVSAAAALFLVGVSPGGHVHIQEMLAGSILWATWSDVLWSAGVFAGASVCFYLFRKPFRTISESYRDALNRRYNTLAWDFLFYALLGVVITTAVRVAGVVVVFTFLIIPATLSAAFASGWAARLAVAWAAGAVPAALGLLFANRYDFSVGPAIGLFLGSALVVVGLLRLARASKPVTAAAGLVIAVVLGVFLAAGTRGPTEAGAARAAKITDGNRGPGGNGVSTHAHPHPADHAYEHGDEAGTDAITAERLGVITDSGQLEELYGSAADAEERSMVILRMLSIDTRSGARMAIEFLRDDPPLLFSMMVVDGLGGAAGHAVDYDVEQPFIAPCNQEAVIALEEAFGLK